MKLQIDTKSKDAIHSFFTNNSDLTKFINILVKIYLNNNKKVNSCKTVSITYSSFSNMLVFYFITDTEYWKDFYIYLDTNHNIFISLKDFDYNFEELKKLNYNIKDVELITH